jgi:hypothetical protein
MSSPAALGGFGRKLRILCARRRREGAAADRMTDSVPEPRFLLSHGAGMLAHEGSEYRCDVRLLVIVLGF